MRGSGVALIGDVVRQFGLARVKVTGTSMLPSVWPGDELSVGQRLVRDVRPGEIAVFTRHDRLFAHRVVANEGGRLLTQGDAVPSRDEPVHDGELLGVVVAVSRNGTTVRVPNSPGVASRLVGVLAGRSSLARAFLRLGRAMLSGSGVGRSGFERGSSTSSV